MKINKQNYVDEAERVIIGLKEADRNGRLALTTSKIRNILSMVSELYTDAQHSREDKLDADMVLIAAGFLGTEKYVADAFGVELNARTNVSTAEGAYATSVKNVFAAGDVHRGQSLVVWAIREGREVAHAVDESLMGYSYLSVQ